MMQNYIHNILRKIKFSLSLYSDTDEAGTIENINDGIVMRSTTIWLLICSTILACIGLDTDSTAVIIGAMLISPLMSPILGIGLGIGINDRSLLLLALINFGIAVGLSLLVSTVYFLLTPLGQPTTELTSRTAPTLLDAGIALFGGIAGIVAGSRKEKTTAIPGVAIATALMPPLCTAGFGIATGRGSYFFGAFYLFFINSVFISLATYFIVRLLKFPHVEFVDADTRRKMKRWMVAFAVIVLTPSIIIFYQVIYQLHLNQQIENFIRNKINNEHHETLRWEISETDSIPILKLFIVGEPINTNEINLLNDRLQKSSLEKLNLKIVQMSVSPEERKKISSEVALNVMKSIEMSQQVQTEKDVEIEQLKLQLQKVSFDTVKVFDITSEVKILFKEITSVSFGKMESMSSDTTFHLVPTVILQPKYKMSRAVRQRTSNRVSEFLKQRLKNDSLHVLLSER